MDYELRFIVADADSTYVVEFIDAFATESSTSKNNVEEMLNFLEIYM